MAAPDFSDLPPPIRTRLVTLGASDVATKVTFPKWARRASWRFITNDGKYASEGGDGDPIDAGFQESPGGALHSVNISRGGRAGTDTDVVSLNFAAFVGATSVRFTFEPGAT